MTCSSDAIYSNKTRRILKIQKENAQYSLHPVHENWLGHHEMYYSVFQLAILKKMESILPLKEHRFIELEILTRSVIGQVIYQ